MKEESVLIRRFFCGLLALAALWQPPIQSRDWQADLVRLHVIADSDEENAQALKLQVRDAVLETAQSILAECESADEAYAVLNENLQTLEDSARTRAEELGWTGEMRAETGVFTFPERTYGGTVVPAGEYRALRIVIGAGEGQNWWCVLYPSMCSLSEDGHVWVIWEWLKKWWGGNEAWAN